MENLESSKSVQVATGNYIAQAAGGAVAVIEGTVSDRHSLREWWHQVLRVHGSYSCYAIFLLLPSDDEAIRYMTEFGRELDFISGESCLIISFSKREFKFREFDEDKWKYIVKEHITDGQGVKIAHLFDINYDEFPCLIAFKDIRSPEHVQVTLKGMEAEEIALRMRVLFSTIREAVAYDEDPLIALERRRSHEKYHNAGNTIVSQVRSLAGKTFESAMKAWIDAAIK